MWSGWNKAWKRNRKGEEGKDTQVCFRQHKPYITMGVIGLWRNFINDSEKRKLKKRKERTTLFVWKMLRSSARQATDARINELKDVDDFPENKGIFSKTKVILL
jgi:hypothetical protein